MFGFLLVVVETLENVTSRYVVCKIDTNSVDISTRTVEIVFVMLIICVGGVLTCSVVAVCVSPCMFCVRVIYSITVVVNGAIETVEAFPADTVTLSNATYADCGHSTLNVAMAPFSVTPASY